jgi:hypothetical protein
MARKSTTRIPGKSNRIDTFAPGAETDIDVTDTNGVAHGHIDGKGADQFRVVTPPESMQTALTYRTDRDLSSNHDRDGHRPETNAWDGCTDGTVETVESTLQDD